MKLKELKDIIFWDDFAEICAGKWENVPPSTGYVERTVSGKWLNIYFDHPEFWEMKVTGIKFRKGCAVVHITEE